MKHPAISELIREAYLASNCKTHTEFMGLFRGAIPKRTFYAWWNGERAALPSAHLLLREYVAGRLPGIGIPPALKSAEA